MPIYEYQCEKCGKHFEYMQRMSDAPKSVCEDCGGALKKLVSASAFHLKGGGWYKDLYSSPKPGSESKSGGESKSSDSKSSDSKSSDSKSSGESKSGGESKSSGGSSGSSATKSSSGGD